MRNKIIKTIFIFTIVLLSTCNDKNATDCFQTSGTMIRKKFHLASFEKIVINERIELFIQESSEQKIIVETGINLLSDIKLTVENNQLEISDNNDCNFFRKYDITKVYLSISNIKRIRNSSTFPVHSIGVLNFDSLELISEDYLSDYLNSGDFNLEVNSRYIKIIANGTSNHKIRGFTDNLNINFAGGNPRFEGSDLLVKNATILTKSTNDILLKVTDKITGNLHSTGNVILFHKPAIIDLKEHFTGEVIFNY